MSWKNDQVSDAETKQILQCAQKTLTTPGDWVEFGCYRGDTSLLLAELLRKNHSDKKLWLYDSFEGLPEKSPQDQSELNPEFKQGSLSVSKRELKVRFLHANIPVPIIKKAWFSELTSDDLPETISFAFLDGDFYESIKTSLGLVAPRLTPDGTILIHDYTNHKLPGVARATDEFLTTYPHLRQSLVLL